MPAGGKEQHGKKNMTIRSRILITLKSTALLLCVLQSHAFATCTSGPDFCTDDPRIPAALAAKKAALSKEYPPRLVSLLDRGVQCVARIERGPDAFTMVIVRNGSIETVLWDEDNENAGKAEIGTGTIKRFWIVHARRAFSCDGQPSYDQHADYDANDDVNTSLAIKCDSSGC